MPGSAAGRNPSAGSSVQSRRRVGTLRKSSSKRNSASLSRDGSLSVSAMGAGNPLPPPPIIQVGEVDEEAKVVVDVKSAAGKKSERDFRLGSGESAKEKRSSGLTRRKGVSASPPTSALTNSETKRPPLDHAKRWSPPPFPSVSSSSSDFSSKSDLSSTSRVTVSPGQRLLSELNATPAYGTQLSLPNAQRLPSQSIDHVANRGSNGVKNRLTSVRLASASAPNLAAFSSTSSNASSGNGSGALSDKDGVTLKSCDWSDDEKEEEQPFLSLAEMSIAISRFNHAVESRSLYDDAKRPVLRSASLTGEWTKIDSSARGDASSVSHGLSPSPTLRRGLRSNEKSRAGRGLDQKGTPKNCLKTIPTGGVKSSFFGDSSSPTKSKIDKIKVPRLAFRGSSSVESGSRRRGGGGGKSAPGGNVGRFASERLKDQECESQLSSEMKTIYRHFKSYDETPRLRRGGTYQVEFY